MPPHADRTNAPRRPRPEGLPVPVTQAHLDAGTPACCYGCPLALALDDATGQVWHVTPTYATLEAGATLRWTFPSTVRALVHAIDAGEPVAPQTVMLPGRFRSFLEEVSHAPAR